MSMSYYIAHKKYLNSKFENSFDKLDKNQIENIRENYKVVDVEWLDEALVNSKMFGDKYFDDPQKKQVIQNLLDFHLSSREKPIYKKTDYLCDNLEQICICNTHADDFRKIYDGINYKPNTTYVSWIKKKNEHF